MASCIHTGIGKDGIQPVDVGGTDGSSPPSTPLTSADHGKDHKHHKSHHQNEFAVTAHAASSGTSSLSEEEGTTLPRRCVCVCVCV